MTVRIEHANAPVRAHAWREIERRWSLPPLGRAIDYGADGGAPVRIPDKQLFENRRAWRVEAERALAAVDAARDPRDLAAALFAEKDGGLAASFDLPAVAFGLLNRWEETLDETRDTHGRWRFERSLLGAGRLVERPAADWIALAIEHAVRRAAGVRDVAERPWNGRPWAAALTWDIDSAGMYDGPAWPRAVRRAAAERRIATAVRCAAEGALCNLGLARDPHDNFEDVAVALARRDLRCTFFVQALRASPVDDYSLRREGRLLRSVRRLRERGHEIGLHGSFATCERDAAFLRRQRRVARSLVGGPMDIHRAHWLRTRGPQDARLYADAGLRIDATPGFSDREGFRLGTCHPVQPWDDARAAPLPLTVVPLHAMDVTLKVHRGFGPEEAARRVRALMDAAREVRGLAVLLWHPHNLEPRFWSGWEDVPFSLMDQARAGGAATGTLGELLAGRT